MSVCFYQASENWWVSKIIKKHKSTYVAIVDCSSVLSLSREVALATLALRNESHAQY